MNTLLRMERFPRWVGMLVFLCLATVCSDAQAQALPKISLQVEDAQQGGDAAEIGRAHV